MPCRQCEKIKKIAPKQGAERQENMANDIKKTLTLQEKFRLLTGKNGWQTDDLDGKIPSVFVADGPHGLRKIENNGEWNGQTHKNTAYPALSLLSCTWDRELAYLMGSSIADDCIENDVDILLAPGVNMKRHAYCGRNFEYFSEDPYLAGELAYAYVDGVQSKGIGTSVKHFACNNTEKYRHFQNSEMDERTLFETYLPAFKRVLEAKPWTVMCSYNIVNGMYASENKRLLKNILRDKFGFDGVIVSDWEAVKNRARALKATLDLEMPHNARSVGDLQEAYEAGYITEAEVDESVERLFALFEKAEKSKEKRKASFSEKERHENAVKIAREGVVLLKNEGGVLPLKAGAKIDYFADWSYGDVKGIIGGWGSSDVQPAVRVKQLFETLQESGYEVRERWNPSIDVYGDYQIVEVGATTHESEGVDRNDLKIRSIDEESILRLAKTQKNIIVVLRSGSAVDCSGWADKVAAIVYAGFGGEGINEALAEILSGRACPSGKLTETYFKEAKERPDKADCTESLSTFYKERFYFGYRHCDKYDEEPYFAFGHGLSYASFEYSDLAIRKLSETDYEVEYTVKNVSNVAAKEVSQVYVSDPVCTSERPKKELKGFSKDLIMPGESKRVKVKLDKSAFAYYNPSLEDYYVENGRFEILVGASSRDIRLSASIEVNLPKFTQCSRNFWREDN